MINDVLRSSFVHVKNDFVIRLKRKVNFIFAVPLSSGDKEIKDRNGEDTSSCKGKFIFIEECYLIKKVSTLCYVVVSASN